MFHKVTKCQAEMQVQMNIRYKVMADQTSTNVINLIQGVVYGLYLLTKSDYYVPWRLFCDYAFIVKNKDWRDVLDRGAKYFVDMKKEAIPGKVVFSLLLPAKYSRKLSKEVEIKEGILIKGQLEKNTMNRIIDDLYIEFGHDYAVDYINHANFLCNKFNTIRGFTFSRTDCLNTKEHEITQCLKDTFAEVAYIRSTPIPDSEKEVLIREVLDKATQIGQKISKDGMIGGELNAMAVATRSGAKGSFVNLAYISCFLGLQTVMNKNYKAELCEGRRVLPCFDIDEFSIESLGFIKNNFYKGLNPIELFYHAWSSRKGLIDTAVTTKTSGYTHRKFGKKMENSHYDTVHVIRNCDGSIIDFCYGEYGFDAAEVYWTDGIAFFTNVRELIHRLNIDGTGKMTPFTSEMYQVLESQLLLPRIDTAPIIQMKKRIMYVIRKQIGKTQIYLNRLVEFFKCVRESFYRARVQAGNMVGFKATCAIGSVSTQDALNAFHSSGTSSKATTTGLPRLEELTNLTGSPKVTGGSFRYQDDILLLEDIEDVEGETKEVTLKKIKMKRVDDLRKIFEYRTFGDFASCEILKTSGSVTNEWEDILQIHKVFKEPEWVDTWFKTMEIERPEWDGGFIIKCKINKEMQYRYKMSLHDICACFTDLSLMAIPSPPSLGIIYIFPNYDDAIIPKSIDSEESSWKYYWTRDIFLPELKTVKMCGIQNIHKIFYSKENIIDYQGHNFKELMKIEKIEFSSLYTDVIWEVVEFLGIHAAYHFLYDELSKCLSKKLNPSHVMLLARTMTNQGFLTNVTRNGIDRRIGIFTKASFETPVDNFISAAIWNENDSDESLASSYFLGIVGRYGTQYRNFELITKKGRKT